MTLALQAKRHLFVLLTMRSCQSDGRGRTHHPCPPAPDHLQESCNAFASRKSASIHRRSRVVSTPPARPLGARDYRTLALAALGGTLEFYDFVIFVFFTSVIGSLFFPPGIPDWLRQFQTFGIFAVG